MSDLPKSVKIKEVGPREGFQFEKGAISLEDKISLVDALTDTGVSTIEFTSFVSPKWVPQMADADQMIAGIRRAPGVAYEAIWLNEAGLERAAKYRDVLQLRPMFSVAGTDTFMRKNTNRSVAERLEELPGWCVRALSEARHGLGRRGRDGGVRLQL
jgi:hydroxymethylglutaryl-CoA lyase